MCLHSMYIRLSLDDIPVSKIVLLLLTYSLKLKSKCNCMAGYIEERAVMKIQTEIDFLYMHM